MNDETKTVSEKQCGRMFDERLFKSRTKCDRRSICKREAAVAASGTVNHNLLQQCLNEYQRLRQPNVAVQFAMNNF